MGTSFLQKVFNDISLQRDQELWMSDDDSRTLDRLQLLAEFPETQFRSQLKLDTVSNTKNPKLAGALREKGNLAYAQGDTQNALVLYNQSLQFADSDPDNETNDLSLGYANRSAVWVDLNEHELAIRDVGFAFESSYPNDLHFKLHERKGLSLLALGKYDEARACVEAAENALPSSSLKGERLKAKQRSLTKLRADIETASSRETNCKDESCGVDNSAKKGSPLNSGGSQRQFVRNLLPKLDSPHPTFPSFSDALRVLYEPGRGRFCVADRDIKSGELIAVESPFTWLLDKEEAKSGSTCWHCFRSAISPIPCLSCAGLVFCGIECRKEAIETYHIYECGLTDQIFNAQIGGWALAYRAVVSRPLEFYLENRDRFTSHNELMGFSSGKEKEGCNEKPLYESTDVMTFHNLVTHDGAGSKLAPELMMQAMTAIFLLRCLKAKKYYVADADASPTLLTETELFLARLLHHFMRVTYYNTHEITTTTVHEDQEDNQSLGMGGVSPEKLRLRRIGRATNPTLALLNHSCDPNYRRVSVGRYTLGFATKNIPKGDEITDTYCPTFAAATKEQRHAGLAKYNFTCNCTACRQGWPTLDKLERKFHNLPTKMYVESVGGKDAIKKQMKRISTADHLVAKILRGCDEGGLDLKRLLEMSKRHLDEIGKLVKQPHHSLVISENKLYHVLLAVYASKSNIDYCL